MPEHKEAWKELGAWENLYKHNQNYELLGHACKDLGFFVVHFLMHSVFHFHSLTIEWVCIALLSFVSLTETKYVKIFI